MWSLLIWLLWAAIALPLGGIISYPFKSEKDGFGSLLVVITIVKVIIVIILALAFSYLLQVNDSATIWCLLILLGCSLICDFWFSENGFGIVMAAIFTIIVFIAAIWISFFSGPANAAYFDSFITKSNDFPIKNEVPDNMLRLATQELAESTASQHMGEFGSSVEIVNSHLGLINNRLYWIITVANKEGFGATYRTAGMILVDANDPSKPVIMLKEKFNVAQGLTFNPIIGANGNSEARGYFGISSANSYGDAYPVVDPTGKWYLAITAYTTDMSGVHHYDGVYLLNQQGDYVEHYTDNLPSWMIKPYDEHGFLERGITDWGKYRRGSGFDRFAGGILWISPSNDRLELTEDTRFIYDPDQNQVVAMNTVHPIRTNGELSLAGVFMTTSEGVTYYDLHDQDLISGPSAGSAVKNTITTRYSSNYYTAMELLYPIQVDNQTKQAWFVPIYYKSQTTNLIGLAGLGIVDAQDGNKVVVEYAGDGVGGEALVAKAKASFRALYSGNATISQGPFESMVVNATFVSRYEPYSKGGYTIQWIVINTQSGKQEILVDDSLLTDMEILTIQKLQPGDKIELEIDGYTVKKVMRTNTSPLFLYN